MATNFLARAKAAQIVKGPRCTMGMALDAMEDQYRQEVERAFADPTIHTTTIYRLLRDDKVAVTENPVRRHRAGGCGCGDAA